MLSEYPDLGGGIRTENRQQRYGGTELEYNEGLFWSDDLAFSCQYSRFGCSDCPYVWLLLI